MDYTAFVGDLANMLAVPVTDAGYQTALPDIINDAEQRIRRDLDLMAFTVVDSSSALQANQRAFTFPQHFVVAQNINVVLPTGALSPLVPADRSVIDFMWPQNASVTTPSIPQYFCMVTDQDIRVGPPPDLAYGIQIIGSVIPTPLSATNTSTYIATYLPDLFMAASLVFAAGYQKNFGAQAEDPRAAMSWNVHYDTLLQSAQTEEMKKRFQADGWTSRSATPLAKPPRG
jgi:hypothetical protein